MICHQCGSFLKDGALTCDHCGAFVGGSRPSRPAQETGVRAIRQGRAGANVPTLPTREGDMREYGDYDLSPLPVESADRGQRRRPAAAMTGSYAPTGGSRPTERRGVPVQGGTAHTPGSKRDKKVKFHSVKRHNVNWMLIGLIIAVLAMGAGVGYMIYMSRSDAGQRTTARKNVLSATELQFELATTKDATLLTEQEALLKDWKGVSLNSYWEVAQEYVDAGDLDTAITAYRMADLLDPDNYDGLIEMASTYELKSENDKAEAIYLDLCTNVSPFRGEAYTALIRLYQNSDRGPEAAEVMKLAYANTDRETFRLQRREYLPQAPQVNLTAGRYEISAMKEDIVLTSPQGFDVYYTMDDAAALPEDGLLSDGGPLQITEGSVTLRAVCVNGKLVSDPMSVAYTFYYPTPPAPKCNLAPNTYKTLKTVSLRAGTRAEFTRKQQAEMEKNLTYYYTIDGSNPTVDSPQYDGTPIQLPSGKVTLKAICINQYGKMSSTLEVGYRFNVKPDPLTVYDENDLFTGFTLNKTTQAEFEAAFGQAQSVTDTAYLYLDAEAHHLEYKWGHAVFALINNQWVLVRIDMNASLGGEPRNVGFGSGESDVCAAYKDYGQLQAPNGTRGLYYAYPTVGQVLIADDGTRYVQYSCQTKESHIWVLQYWLQNGQVKRIVHYYQP